MCLNWERIFVVEENLQKCNVFELGEDICGRGEFAKMYC